MHAPEIGGSGCKRGQKERALSNIELELPGLVAASNYRFTERLRAASSTPVLWLRAPGESVSFSSLPVPPRRSPTALPWCFLLGQPRFGVAVGFENTASTWRRRLRASPGAGGFGCREQREAAVRNALCPHGTWFCQPEGFGVTAGAPVFLVLFFFSLLGESSRFPLGCSEGRAKGRRRVCSLGPRCSDSQEGGLGFSSQTPWPLVSLRRGAG